MIMKPSSTRSDSNLDDRLADFTDRARSNQAEQIDSQAERELRDLEDMVLRINRAFPSGGLEAPAVMRMQARLNARRQDEIGRTGRHWRSARSRQRLVFTFASLAVIGALILLIPSLTTGGSGGTAAALSPATITVAASALAGALLLGLWLRRHK